MEFPIAAPPTPPTTAPTGPPTTAPATAPPTPPVIAPLSSAKANRDEAQSNATVERRRIVLDIRDLLKFGETRRGSLPVSRQLIRRVRLGIYSARSCRPSAQPSARARRACRGEVGPDLCQASNANCRPMIFRACLYRRGIVVEASSPRGGGGFAAFPGPSEKWPEIAQIMSIITASALNAMRTCVPREPLAANALSKDRTSRALPFGNNATRWAAINFEGTAFARARGSASISSVNRAAAASLGIRARLVASCQ